MTMSIQTLTGLHFLIHPMFLGDTSHISDPDPSLQNHLSLMAFHLGDRYSLKASMLEPSEAMVVFSHLTRSELEGRQDDYTDLNRTLLRTFDTLLGDRFLLVSGNSDLFGSFFLVGDVALELHQRGLHLGPKTTTYAYGEKLRACVTFGAMNLQEGFGLKKPTTIEMGLTDAAFWWEKSKEEEKQHVRDCFLSSGLSWNEDFIP